MTSNSTARWYGYVSKGHRVDDLISGHRRPRTSLIAARMEGRLEEPLLFAGTCDTMVFNTWLQTMPSISSHSIVGLFTNHWRRRS